jgi:rhodanese-related sulfurtransferase
MEETYMKTQRIAAVLFCIVLSTTSGCAGKKHSVYKATLDSASQKTPEISTEEMKKIIDAKSAVLLDARPFAEWAVSHIPGSIAVAPKPGVSKALYVSDITEIGRIVNGNKNAALVLYCDGTYCGKSKRLADELLANGYTNVRRYQLGIPVWRALGYPTQSSVEGIRYILAKDKTAVFIDARDAAAYKRGALDAARNIPASRVLQGKDVGEVRKAKDDGRLPVEDRNTRIVVFGDSAGQAAKVADALAKEAFHNVSYYAGDADTLRTAVQNSR